MAIARFVEAGAEVTSRGKDIGDRTVTLRTVSAVLLIRPPVISSLRLRGSMGVAARKHSGRMDDILLDLHDTGQYRSAGISYDWRALSRLSLTPGFEIGAIDFGDEKAAKMWEYRLALTLR